jgi:hypothetical protein
MQAGERRTAYRVPAGLEAAIRGFAEAMNMRVVAYASLGEQRAYCVLRAAHGTKSEETLYFASLTGGALRVEPVPEIADCPHLRRDLIALVKRANEPLETTVR